MNGIVQYLVFAFFTQPDSLEIHQSSFMPLAHVWGWVDFRACLTILMCKDLKADPVLPVLIQAATNLQWQVFL